METFFKWQNEVIGGSNKNNLFEVNISKVGHVYSKWCVNSRCLIRVIDKQVDDTVRSNQTIHNASKGINIVSNTMYVMVKDVNNI